MARLSFQELIEQLAVAFEELQTSRDELASRVQDLLEPRDELPPIPVPEGTSLRPPGASKGWRGARLQPPPLLDPQTQLQGTDTLLEDRAIWQREADCGGERAYRSGEVEEGCDGEGAARLASKTSSLSVLANSELEFGLWPLWDEQKAGPHSVGLCPVGPSTPKFNFRGSNLMLGAESENLRAGDEIRGNGFLQRLVCRPSSQSRIAWDLAGLCMLGWDVIFLPLQVFNVPWASLMEAMDIVIAAFWTSDFFASFFVGFYDAGLLEMRFKKIAKRYMKTWLFIDVTVLSVDWTIIFHRTAESADLFGMARLGKMLRVMRVLRMFRLMRLFKVMAALSELNDYIRSESLLILLGVVKLAVMIAAINHIVACCWYAIGTSGVSESTWIKQLEEETSGNELNIPYLYTTALHWSLTQFTPSSMEVVPRNSYERIFTVCVIIFALISFSSFVSSITAAMTHLRTLNKENTRQQMLIRQYLNDNKMPLELGNRVLDFFKHYRHEQKGARVTEEDLPNFKAMPESLRFELHAQLHAPLLMPHPFFYNLRDVDAPSLDLVAHRAVSMRLLICGHDLFTSGEEATGMTFVVSGALLYVLMEREPVRLRERDHVCEMALWLRWQYRGTLTARTTCQLGVLDSEAFRSVIARSAALSHVRRYAVAYVEQLLGECQDGDFTRLSDIWKGFDAAQELAQRSFESNDTGGAGRQQSPFLKKKSLVQVLETSLSSVSQSSLRSLAAAQQRVLGFCFMGRRPVEAAG